jgi:ADP-heptose:LPS heptosyltransferase
LSTLIALCRLPRPDLVVIPAENRYSLLAAALGARWVVGFEGDRPGWKNWFVDELRPYPATPTAWPDMAAQLLDGPPPPPFKVGDWPAPAASDFVAPTTPWCVLHVGASSSLRHWTPERWRAVADWLAVRGYTVVWSAGAGELDLVRRCDPEGRYMSTAGTLSLAALWHLLAGAALLVSPDTGVAHLGKAAGARCVTLFGPGSAVIYGPGRFFSDLPYRPVTVEPFHCRDGRMLFERTHVMWVRHCARPPSACAAARCMDALTVDAVLHAIEEVLQEDK